MTEIVTGRVVGCEAKNGGWMEALVLQPNGFKQKISTKDLKRWADLKPGLSIKAECSVTENPNPRGGNPFKNYYINSWMIDDEAPLVPVILTKDSEMVTNNSDDNPWPGKDRAMNLMSAYKTAAEFYKPRLTFIDADGKEWPYLTDHLHTLAIEIYTNVQRAQAGEL